MKPKKVIHRKRDREDGREMERLFGAVERIDALSRRDVLKGGAAVFGAMLAGSMAALLGRTSPLLADEAVKTGKFIFPRLKFSVNDDTGDVWNTGPIGDAVLRKHLRKLTNINASEEAKTVLLSDFDDLCRYPFVFMTSEGSFKLPDKEEKNLREFLERGGFIHSDDCVIGNWGDKFFRCYVALMDRLFRDNPMRKIPNDNEIFHCYYDFPNGCPHMQGVKHGAFGLFEPGTGRIMTVCTPGDLHCGWMCQYFGKKQDLASIKMGINIIIYFLSH